jgi:hypothetical protein
MKRTSALPVAALAVAITFGSAACSDDSPNPSSDTTEAPDSTEATETTETSETTDAGGDTTDGPENTAEVLGAGGEPTVETATPVLVGLAEDEATEAAEALGWEVRVIRREGEDLPMTMDLRTNRVNVEVADGKVTEVIQIG